MLHKMNEAIDEEDFARAIGFIARMAERVALDAGVGGMDIAGMIVSYLYGNPHKIPDFIQRGPALMIDDPDFNALNGGLSWNSIGGEVITPAEHKRRSGKASEIQ